MTNITHDATTLTPLLVLGYKSTRRSGNIIHRILDLEAPAVTFGPTGLRSGTLTILCADHAAALAMEALHANPGSFELEDADLPGVDMFYVPSGDISSELDRETRVRWTVTVDFQEVVP